MSMPEMPGKEEGGEGPKRRISRTAQKCGGEGGKMLNRIVRWLAFREFFVAALKEGGLHIHRDPVRKAKNGAQASPLPPGQEIGGAAGE